MEITTQTRKWGNSLAIIIPKVIVNSNHIKENQQITLEIKSKPIAREVFGMLPKWKRSAQEIKDDMRKGW